MLKTFVPFVHPTASLAQEGGIMIHRFLGMRDIAARYGPPKHKRDKISGTRIGAKPVIHIRRSLNIFGINIPRRSTGIYLHVKNMVH